MAEKDRQLRGISADAAVGERLKRYRGAVAALIRTIS